MNSSDSDIIVQIGSKNLDTYPNDKEDAEKIIY
jgi:hypothetical protein